MVQDRLLIEIGKWARVIATLSTVVIVIAIAAAALLELGLVTLSHGRETVQQLFAAGVLGLVAGAAGFYGSRVGRGLGL